MKKFFLSTIVALLMAMVGVTAKAAVTITAQGGWFESAYVEFTPDGSSYYNVYYSTNQSSWTKIDDQLVRKYSSSKGRADVVGISAGTYYIKVASVNASGTETSSTVSSALTVKAHDRAGFAHLNWSQGVGAYKNDGTLKSNANVLYITKSNAKTITMTVPSASNKTAVYTGLQAVIDAWTKAHSKGWSTAPLCIRVLGTLSAADMDSFSSSAEGIQIKGANTYADCPITFEGIGNDAVIHGFGFLIRNTTDLELRNFAIMDCLDDCVSIDSNNSHIWVHNLDLFYGQAGGAADQKKGDGTIDMKGDSRYITVSYNRFWDSGKSSLCGMKSETGPNYITYHHNWFDHSDSRHPRIRTMSVHVYNNYFDGCAKYGVGAVMGASCFVDRNYFRNCKYPMMISMQGSDVYAGGTTRDPSNNGTFSSEASGMIKAYGNYMTGTNTYITYGASTYLLKGTANTPIGNINSSQDFDAYEVPDPSQTVPNTVTGYSGGSTYDNFDTNPSLMYSYTADAAADVPSVVTGTYGAGRLQHGSYQYDLTGTDASYSVISALKSDVEGYKSTSYYTPVTNSMYFKDGVITDDPAEQGGEEEDPSEPTASDDATLKSLSVSGYSLSFSPSTTYYAVTLNYGTETAPTVSAAANNSAATVLITQATSTTGKATVKVTAEDGSTIKIYEVQFSVAAEPVEPTPAGTIISTALTLNIGDGSNAYQGYLTGTYNTSTSCNATYGSVTNNSLAIKMESSTSISFTTTKAFTMTFVADGSQTASFKIDGTTVAASSGNTASVDVAAGTHTLTKSGAIKMCFLDFADVEEEPVEPEPVLSDDATLSNLAVAGYTLSPAFNAGTMNYSVELAAGTTTLPVITATQNDSNASVDVDTEDCNPAGQAVIQVTAEDGSTKNTYYINFSVATAYFNVSASAGSGGSATVSPSGSVAEGTQVTFTATANDGFTFSKWSDDSTENPRNVTVTADISLTASFTENSTPTPTPSGDVVLLEVNGASVSAGGTFTGSTCTTSVKFTGSTEVEDNSDKSSLSTSTGTVYRTGDTTAMTIGLNSTSASQIVIGATSSGSGTRTITGVSVDNVPLESSDYTVTGSFVGKTTVSRVTISGLNVAQGSTVTISTSGNTHYYYFEVTPTGGSTPAPASTDATLSDLQVNGTTVTGFSAETLSYDVTLPYGTTAIPTVTYTVNDNKASSVLNNASALPGSTTVTVTAEDGTTTKTYTVNFTVLQSIVLVDGEDYTATEDVTYADGVTYTRTFNSNLVNKWTSFYVPFAVNVEDYLTQFDIAEIFAMCPVFDTNNDGEVTAEDEAYLILMKKTSGTTQPNKPYLIRAKSAGVQEIEAVDGKVYAAANGTVSCATTNNSYTFTGVYSPVTANPENGYWYMSSGSLSHKTSGSANISSNRWYMEVSDVDKYNSTSSTQNSINIAVIGEDMDNATAVNAIKQGKGQLTDRIYNLGGVQVDANYRGISIRNGKAYIK